MTTNKKKTKFNIVIIKLFLFLSVVFSLIFTFSTQNYYKVNASTQARIITNKIQTIEIENDGGNYVDTEYFFTPNKFTMPLALFQNNVETNRVYYLADLNTNIDDITYTTRIYIQINVNKTAFNLYIGTDLQNEKILAKYEAINLVEPYFEWTITTYASYMYNLNTEFYITRYSDGGIFNNNISYNTLIGTDHTAYNPYEIYRTYVLVNDNSEIINNSFNDGFNQGVLQGQEDILTNLSGYGLYDDYQVEQISLEAYNNGILYGNANALRFENIFNSVFRSFSNVMNIQIFPGITLGLVIGLPLLFTLLIIILKIARG